MSTSYHFIGIGGAGMSALARVLAARGAQVSGSDQAASPTLEALEQSGIKTYVGHEAAHLENPDCVVASAAIKEDNPELEAARHRKIPIVSRAKMLQVAMEDFTPRIAVAGTHGKTTTTAMIAQMLESAGLDPTALIGGDVPAWHSNARVGQGEVIVAEACEAYGSFLELWPTIAVVTNLEADHLDYYEDLDAVKAAFETFLSQTSSTVILCGDDPNCRSLNIDPMIPNVLWYGLEGDADVTATIETLEERSRFTVTTKGEALGTVALAVPGRHNVLNALAAVTVGLELGVPFDVIAEGLAQFLGTGRRFEILGRTNDDVLVVDDYAHHPTEIRATLAAARGAYPTRRLVAVFQPHLPSRTRDFLDEFAQSLGAADEIVLTDIYLSREKPLDGLTGETLADKAAALHGRERVHYVADKAALTEALLGLARPGDLVLTLGAGDIRQAAIGFLAKG